MKARNSLSLAAAILVGLAALNLSAQTPQFLWAKRVAGTVNQDGELAIGLAMDGATNLYVTGWFDGTNDFGGVVLTNKSGGGQDIFVGKYNSSGALQWAQRAGGSSAGRDAGRGVGVDTNGNVYVAGGFYGTADFGTFNLTASQNQDFFLAKYNSAGTVQWVRQNAGGGNSAYAIALAVDGNGNSYAVGYYNGSGLTFGTTTLANFGNYNAFLVKYDNTGAFQWANSLNSPGWSYANGVTLDSSGNVYVTGTFNPSLGIGAIVLTSAGGKDGFVAKFNSAGALQWARQVAGNSDDLAQAASVDVSGNVYVCGGFGNAAGDTVSFGSGITLTNIGGGKPGAGIGDAYLAKYNGSGSPQWARRTGGAQMDVYSGVSADSQGNIYVAGGTGSAIAPGAFNLMIARYDSNGAAQLAPYSTSTLALPWAGPLVDAGGNCYMAGWFQTSAVFGNNTLNGQGYFDYFLAKLAPGALVSSNAPAIAFQPQSQTVVVSNTVQFTVTATGSGTLSYQWRRNGTNLVNVGTISGVTTTNLAIASVQTNDAGSFSVVVTNAYGSVTSSIATLTVAMLLGDDFNGTITDPNKWGPDLRLIPGGQLVQTNGQLQFFGNELVGKPWIGNYGSYTQDWQVVVDVNLGNALLVQDGSYIRVGLSVTELNSPVAQNGLPGNRVDVGLGLGLYAGQVVRSFGAPFYVNGIAAAGGSAMTTNQHASVQVTFAAATKTLTAWYDTSGLANGHNWTPFAAQQINVSPVDWGMNAGSAFQFVIGVDCSGYSVNMGDQVYADSFMVAGSVPASLPYSYTTNNGTITITGYTGSGGAVTIPGMINGLQVTSIGDSAFHNCSGLTNIMIPSSVNSIGNLAFSGCTNLKGLCFQGNAPSLGSSVFDGDNNATIFYLPGTTGWGTTFGGRPTAMGDDFNATVEDTSKWGQDIISDAGAQLVQTNGQLQYLGLTKAARPWVGSYGSYTQNWELVMDLNLGNAALTQDSTQVRVGFWVASVDAPLMPDGTPSERLSLGLGLKRLSGQNYRAFGFGSYTNGMPADTSTALTTNQHVSVRMTFDATAKTLASWYDASGDSNAHHWIALSVRQLNVPPLDWGMTDSSAFRFAVVASSDGYAATASDQVYADNVQISGSVGVLAVAAVPSLTMANSATGLPQMRLFGTTGIYCDIEKSTNLVNWDFLGRALAGAVLDLAQIDPAWRTSSRGFFRAPLASSQQNLPPTITLQPVGVTASTGASASFVVGATGSLPLLYQWQWNGTNIAGATNVSIVFTNLQPSQAGLCSVIITNIAGGVASLGAPLQVYAGAPLGDDFNGPNKDTSKWGPDLNLEPGGGQLVQTNGHLQFLGGGSVARPWIGSCGSYTQDWQVAADVHLGNVALTQNPSHIQVVLATSNPQATNVMRYGLPGDNFSIVLDLYRDPLGAFERSYETYFYTNWSEIPPRATTVTASLEGNLRIAFDSRAKTLSAYYDGNLVRTVNIAQAGSSWGMTDTSTFLFSLAVGSGGFTASASDEVYADNFVARGTVASAPPALSLSGLYITNATVLPNGYGQFSVVTPTNGIYSLLFSTNLQTWESVETLDGTQSTGSSTNRFIITTPRTIAKMGTCFVRVAAGLVPRYQFRLGFHDPAGPLEEGTANLVFPQHISDWQASLDVDRVPIFADGTNVFFTGPPGSGLTNARPQTFDISNGPHGSWYGSPIMVAPSVPPPGRWTVNYGGTNLTFDLPDAQTSTRFIVPQPTIVVSNGLFSSVSWVYRNATTGQELGAPPAFLNNINVWVAGGTPYGQLYDSDLLPPETTNHVLSSAIVWTNVTHLEVNYGDDLGNSYSAAYDRQ